MRDIMCFKKGGKLMNNDEAKKVGGKTMTEKLFKKQTSGLAYSHLVLGEDSNGRDPKEKLHGHRRP